MSNPLDRLTIRMKGMLDKNDDEYYFSTCKLPVSIDLSKAVIHFFPDHSDDDNDFGGDLVIRLYEGKSSPPVRQLSPPVRRRRRSKGDLEGTTETEEVEETE